MGCVMSSNNSHSVQYIDDPSTSESETGGRMIQQYPNNNYKSCDVPIVNTTQQSQQNPNQQNPNQQNQQQSLQPITIPPAASSQLHPIPIITESSYGDGILHGRFVKERLLGQGAIAKVYLYTDQLTQQKVAIKKFNRAYLSSQKMYRNSGPGARLKITTLWEKAENEVAVLSYLHSCGGGPKSPHNLPHICPVYAVINDPSLEHMFIVMEYGEGGVIGELDETGYHYTLNSLKSEEEAFGIYQQLLVMLEGLRHVGVVHNDIKPANLVINASGVVKLIDFGEAVVVPVQHPILLEHFLKLQEERRAQSPIESQEEEPIAQTNNELGLSEKIQELGPFQTQKLQELEPSKHSTIQVISKLQDLFPESDNDTSDFSLSEDEDEGSYEMAGLDNNGVFGTIDIDDVNGVNEKSKSLKDPTITTATFDSNSWYKLGIMHQGPGTPFFGGPESCMGDYNGFDNDLWAAAVCLFVMVLGYLPFFSPQNNPQATLYASLQLIQSGKIEWKSPLKKPIKYSEGFKGIIETLMRVEPPLSLTECQQVEFKSKP